MKTRTRLLLVSLALLIAISTGAGLFFARDRAAAGGTSMGYCLVPTPYVGTSTALAFDGVDLAYANPDSTTLYKFNPTAPCPQAGSGPALQGELNTYGLAYDPTHSSLWAVSINDGVSSVYTIDLAGGAPTPKFDLAGGTFQGIAYDASDDTLWASAWYGHIIGHFSTTDGTLLDSCIVNFAPSGLLVGGGQILISANFAVNAIARSSCTGGAIIPPSTTWSTNGFESDLACDPFTFPGTEVIWSKEAGANAVTAWSVDPGTCAIGGPGTPTPTPTDTPTETPVAAPTETPTATPTVDPNLDTDGDGYPDVLEVSLGKDPNTYCAIMRADVNGDHVTNLLDLAAVALQFGQDIPPGNPRYDQNQDAKLNLLDLASQALVFGQDIDACP